VVTDNNIFISQSPGFNLERVIDNKKILGWFYFE
jgi:hypothetical protein